MTHVDDEQQVGCVRGVFASFYGYGGGCNRQHRVRWTESTILETE